MKLAKFIFLISLCFISSVNAKNNMELTGFASYRIGGDFNDSENDTSIKLEDGNGYGLLFNWHYDKGRQGELLFSQYKSDINYNENTLQNSEISISYLHLGGNIQVAHGVVPFWISGGLGATFFSPDDESLDDETKLSGSIGLSSRFNVTDNLSLRIEGRVYGTFFDNDSAVFCTNGNCTVFVENEVWVQTELMAGITFAF